jgi:hypothetical protein
MPDIKMTLGWPPPRLATCCEAPALSVTGGAAQVRAVDSLEVVQLFSCLDRVRRLEWCCRSEYLLCQLRKPVVQVPRPPALRAARRRPPAPTPARAQRRPGVVPRGAGGAGLQGRGGRGGRAARLLEPRRAAHPHGRRLPDPAGGLVLGRWSLPGAPRRAQARQRLPGLQPRRRHAGGGRGATRLSPPPLREQAGAAARPDAARAAQRRGCRDRVSLYACADWAPLAHAEVGTSDLEGLAFAPDGTCLAAWDSPLQYGVVVLALDGRPLARYRAYEDALGVKCASWAPSGQLLAVGSYDQARPRPGSRWALGGERARTRQGAPTGAQEARLLDHASWLPAASLAHPEHLADAPAGFVAFREVGAAAPPARGPAGDAAKAGARAAVRMTAGAGRAAGAGAGAPAAPEEPRTPQPATHYVVCGLPLRLPAARPVLDKPALRMGIGAPGPAQPRPAGARGSAPALTRGRGAQARRCGAPTASSWRRATTRSPSACGCGARRSWRSRRSCSRCPPAAEHGPLRVARCLLTPRSADPCRRARRPAPPGRSRAGHGVEPARAAPGPGVRRAAALPVVRGGRVLREHPPRALPGVERALEPRRRLARDRRRGVGALLLRILCVMGCDLGRQRSWTDSSGFTVTPLHPVVTRDSHTPPERALPAWAGHGRHARHAGARARQTRS